MTESFYQTSSPPGLKGIWAWLLTHDHKRIGILYLWTIGGWFCIALLCGLLLRLELMSPGKTIMGPEAYNSLFTLHGVIMIFLFVIPAIPSIFGNFFLPIQIGTDDVFFPRLNLLSMRLKKSFLPEQRQWMIIAASSSARLPSLIMSG